MKLRAHFPPIKRPENASAAKQAPFFLVFLVLIASPVSLKSADARSFQHHARSTCSEFPAIESQPFRIFIIF